MSDSMTLTLPLWGWAAAVVGILLSLLFAYACGGADGMIEGVDFMKREAIRAGVAKACDFDGGWRWWTREEITAGTRTTIP